MHYSSILPDVIKVAEEASERVLHIYQSDFKVDYKEDNTLYADGRKVDSFCVSCLLAEAALKA